MPTVLNDNLIDILPLLLRTSRSDKRCYLCTRVLDKPRKVAKLPSQYQICCACRKMLKTFAKEQLDYYNIIELIEKTSEKIILSQEKVKKNLTKERKITLTNSQKPYKVSL